MSRWTVESCLPPSWASAVEGDVRQRAQSQASVEMFGLFTKKPQGQPQVRFPTVSANNHSFILLPQTVIDLCYELTEAGDEILGTCHSHPDKGTQSFSHRDQGLLQWGTYHLILVPQPRNPKWQCLWYRRVTVNRGNIT